VVRSLTSVGSIAAEGRRALLAAPQCACDTLQPRLD